MSYLNYEDIKEVHFEPTLKCNAQCPQCSRNIFGANTAPNLPQVDVHIEDIDRIFEQKFCEQLELVLFCGTHGDPIASEYTLKAAELMKQRGLKSLWIYTNGSARPKSWWSQLGKILNSDNDRVCFSIDGLEDTNHLYRRGTNWQRIMDSVESYISAGGNARWEFLVFRHNEHQVEEARQLAKKLGFKDFRIRKTSRFKPLFFGDSRPATPVIEKMTNSEAEDFVDRFLNIPNTDYKIQYYIEPPENPEYQNQATYQHYSQIVREHGSLTKYANATDINCLYRNHWKRIYISGLTKLWPCCHLSSSELEWKKSIFVDDFKKKISDRYGDSFNSLKNSSIQEILEHPWFKTELQESWSNQLDSENNPRLFRCGRTCGTGYSPILTQTEEIKLSEEPPPDGKPSR